MIIKPILAILTLPLIILTFGLSYFAINVLMLALAEWLTPDFSIDGFWTYVGATIVVWLVNVSVGWLLDRVRRDDVVRALALPAHLRRGGLDRRRVIAQVFGALDKASRDPGAFGGIREGHGLPRRWVFMPASLVVLVSGILLVEDGNWDWSEPFVVLGLLGWVVVSFTFFGYLTRAMNRVGMRMATEGPSPELGAEMNRLVLLARIMILVLFALVFVMVVKPGT